MSAVVCELPRTGVLFVAAFGLLAQSGCGEDRRFDPQFHATLDALQEVLIDAKLCKDHRECSSKEYILGTTNAEGIVVSAYGVADPAIWRALERACAQVFEEQTLDMRVTFQIFRQSKSEQLRAPMGAVFDKPIFVAKMERSHLEGGSSPR